MRLDTNIKYLKGVGEKRAVMLSRLGVSDANALLRLYPRVYEDWSRLVSIEDAQIGQVCCIKAVVGSPVRTNMIRRGLTLYKTEVTDGKSIMSITIFNSKFAADKLQVGEEYLFFGKVGGNLYKKEMNSPEIEPAVGADRIRPIYPQTQGLTSRAIEKLVRTAIACCEDEFTDPLPVSLRERFCLMDLKTAIENIHFPKNQDYLYEARRRLIFEELLILQLGLLRMRGRGESKAGIVLEKDCSEEYFSLLPFTPTNAQRRAVSEAMNDMTSGQRTGQTGGQRALFAFMIPIQESGAERKSSVNQKVGQFANAAGLAGEQMNQIFHQRDKDTRCRAKHKSTDQGGHTADIQFQKRRHE